MLTYLNTHEDVLAAEKFLKQVLKPHHSYNVNHLLNKGHQLWALLEAWGNLGKKNERPRGVSIDWNSDVRAAPDLLGLPRTAKGTFAKRRWSI